MNVWIVTIGEVLPTDKSRKKHRSALLADVLVKKGHNVLFFASAFDHLEKKWAYQKDTTVKLNQHYELLIIKGCGYKKNISLRRFIDHRIIARKFSQVTPRLPKPDVIIASMPPHDLAYEAVMFAGKNSIPILVDIRDPWPDIFLQKIPGFLAGLFRKLLFREFYLIRETMQCANGLVATAGTLLDWGLNYSRRNKSANDKVIYLAQKRAGQFESNIIPAAHWDLAKKIENKFTVIFIGTFAHYHNPLILVEAARRLLSNSQIHFIIAGSGQLQPEIEKQSADLSNVTLTGWLNETEINFWLSKSKAGVCPTPVNIDILPNKAGTYLSAGLPVISAFHGDLKAMIEKENIGFYFPPGDADALVECILKIYKDKNLYGQMSASAKRIFDEKFEAKKIYEEYANHIEMVNENYVKR